MRYITLANLRSGAGRLVAAGIAVMISVAFIAAVLSLSQAWNDTMRSHAEGSAAGSDIIVSDDTDAPESGTDEPMDAKAADKLADDARELPAVAGTQTMADKFGSVKTGAQDQYVEAQPMPIGRHLDLVEGSKPSSHSQVAVYEDVAKSLGLHQGQRIKTTMEQTDDAGSSAAGHDKPVTLTVAGIIRGSDGGTPTLYASDSAYGNLPGDESVEGLRIVLSHAGNAKAQQHTAHQLAKTLAEQRGSSVKDRGSKGLVAGGYVVQTNQQVVDEQVKQLTGESFALQAVVLGFGAIALFVAALVIANTFQVIVASRTRTLALLRAIGATKGQIQRATLVEGFVLGLAGSILGILLGWGAGVGLSLAARAWWMPGFALAGLPISAVIGGLAVGVIVTVLACIVPARKATRVTPIQALAPVDVPPAVAKFPLARAIFGGLLVLAGALLTVAGALLHSVLVALPAAILAFCGVLVLARVIVPPLVQGGGRLLERLTHQGPVAGLVARNVRLVPRRTASTTSALLIGVTLVTTMMVGAQTVKTTSESALAKSHAADVSVSQPDQHAKQQLKDSDIVTETSMLKGVRVSVPPAKLGGGSEGGKVLKTTALAATDRSTSAARDKDLVPPKGTVWANENEYPTNDQRSPDPSHVTLEGKHGSVKVTVKFGHGVPSGQLLANKSDLAPLHPTLSQGAMWAQTDDDASSADVQKLVTALGEGTRVDAEGSMMRAQMATIINIVLAIVLALLAASLVVAVVGVANTLSLSVMERRRETALLRAMGMTRGQVSSMVTVEAVLIAVVAVVLGLVLGVFFSWAGISSLLADEDVGIVVGLPWGQLAGVVVASLLAALLASLIPARSVNRTKPAEGLSAE